VLFYVHECSIAKTGPSCLAQKHAQFRIDEKKAKEKAEPSSFFCRLSS
jgi:hypothetical protein